MAQLAFAALVRHRIFYPNHKNALHSGKGCKQGGYGEVTLVSGKSDVPPAHYAGRAFFSWLLKRGIIRIYNYHGEVLHAKSYVFDGCWSIVGSANLDFLSLRRNDEGNVGILDEEFGKRMICVFEEDLESSIEIKEEEWGKRPLSERMKERFFVLFKRKL